MTKSQKDAQVIYTYQDPISKLETQQVKQTDMFDFTKATDG